MENQIPVDAFFWQTLSRFRIIMPKHLGVMAICRFKGQKIGQPQFYERKVVGLVVHKWGSLVIQV